MYPKAHQIYISCSLKYTIQFTNITKIITFYSYIVWAWSGTRKWHEVEFCFVLWSCEMSKCQIKCHLQHSNWTHLTKFNCDGSMRYDNNGIVPNNGIKLKKMYVFHSFEIGKFKVKVKLMVKNIYTSFQLTILPLSKIYEICWVRNSTRHWHNVEKNSFVFCDIGKRLI